MRKKLLPIVALLLIVIMSLVSCAKVDISDVKGRYELASIDMITDESQVKIYASSFSYFEVIVDEKNFQINYKFSENFQKTLADGDSTTYELSAKKYKYTSSDDSITVPEGDLKGVYTHKRGIISGRINILNIACDFVVVIVKK